MVSKTKTIVARSWYKAPSCKIYSITVESVIAGSPDGTQTPVEDGEEDF